MSTIEIAKIFGCSQWVIWALMNKYEIEKRSATDFLKWRSPGNSIKPSLGPSSALAYILGVFLGDGWIYHRKHTYSICLEAKDREFCESFMGVLSEIGLHPSILYKDKREVWRVTASSKSFYKLLNSFDHQKIRNLAKEYPKDFIRGFYESEGCLTVYRPKKYQYVTFQVCIVNTNKWLIHFLKDLLEELQFSPTVHVRRPQQPHWKPIWVLSISRKAEVIRFLEEIKPCIKGNLKAKLFKLAGWNGIRNDYSYSLLELREAPGATLGEIQGTP